MTSRRRPFTSNAFCLLLLAAALVMRALLPGGVMIESDRGGPLVVTICNSGMTMTIPVKQDAPAPDDGQDQGEPCAFAGHAAADLPPAQYVPLPQLAAAAYDATRAQALSPDSPRLLPPATGPPVHA